MPLGTSSVPPAACGCAELCSGHRRGSQKARETSGIQEMRHEAAQWWSPPLGAARVARAPPALPAGPPQEGWPGEPAPAPSPNFRPTFWRSALACCVGSSRWAFCLVFAHMDACPAVPHTLGPVSFQSTPLCRNGLKPTWAKPVPSLSLSPRR